MNTIRPIFKNAQIDIELIKCEDIHIGNTGLNSQDVIDNHIRECNISLFLFKSQANENTIHEFDVARELQKTQPPHVIFVYMFTLPKKKSNELINFQDRLKKEKFYWKTCKGVDSLTSQFLPGLVQHLLGSQEASAIEQKNEIEEDGDTEYAEYKQNEKNQAKLREKIHQNIDNLLLEIKTKIDDEKENIVIRILKAKELYEKADLWASKTNYDKEKYRVLLFNYALFLYKYGLYRDSEAVLLRQIPLAEELYGTEHEDTATSYNNIGSVYWNQGNYPKALDYYFKALEIREKVLGTDHPDTATTYNNIGAVYDAQGDYPKALEYYYKALEVREKKLGTDHPDTATTYNNIGGVYYAQGDYPKALEYYYKALEIYEKVLGTEHPNTATSYNNIGGVYDAQGDYPKALKYYKKALEIDEKVFGTDHPSTATEYNNIGGVYDNQGDYPKALEYYFKALKIYEKVLGTEHPSTARDYNNIGSLYYTTKEYDKALKYLSKALKIFETKLGPNHPDTQDTQGWIDLVHAAMREGHGNCSFFQRLKSFFKL